MNELERFRREKDEFFARQPQSPIPAGERAGFKGLLYFPENPELDLIVRVDEFPAKEEVEFQTSSGDVQHFRRFGKIKFSVNGVEVGLTIYDGEHGFFLPFVDSQAGKETYGAGRYLEPEPLGDGRIRVDFNRAYNPFCAYNENYSCPLTPFENRLNVPIEAGEKNYK